MKKEEALIKHIAGDPLIKTYFKDDLENRKIKLKLS